MKTAQEYHNLILSLAASATLADHMGDMWSDINKVLEDIGEKELADADHEIDEENEDEGTASSEFTRILAGRGIKTVWDTEI